MAEQAEVYVSNMGDFPVEVQEVRPDETVTKSTIEGSSPGTFILPGANETLKFKAPESVKAEEFFIKVKSLINLDISYSFSESTWSVSTIDGETAPPVPTTVNITIGEEGP